MAEKSGADGKLFIGTKRYSSWSLRGWLAVHLAGLDVEEVLIPLAGGGNTAAIKQATPTGLVPYLEHKGARVWESLAIAEYCAEIAPALWPEDRVLRALLRSAASEMHAGFRALRQAMPMNLGGSFAGRGGTPDALADIARIETIWSQCLDASGGPFLHGATMGVADVMYAPVVARLITYAPAVSPRGRAYMAAVRAHPLVARWYDEAAQEPKEWLLAHYEAGPAA
ncbi:glutathione S-transferase family protein [Pararoseomonas indoligenes]|uniref:Glutathione S-transferase family protein n=1 Tax=Roseomonas indoligenes TaxID=2820811 RepID=A0A940N2K2_9PROT|nr:glutathione S-transferase family protein [Pararoseomonas indoligenes]MBP0494030.1 glutathione S-transferase family protein [Pararoseomonas indoligenes]